MMIILPTRQVGTLTPYRISESGGMTTEEKTKYVKLDWNEAAYPPSPLVRKALLRFIETGAVRYYPDVTARELREELAHYIGLPVPCIQVFNGSDAALRDICDTYLALGDNMLVREPVYTQIYTLAGSRGAKLVKFTGQDPFTKALDGYSDHLSDQNIRIVYLVNPNNPTGVLYEKSEIEFLASSYPATLFIVDEAYYELSGITVADLIPKHHNIVVTRTFSKAFGLAGLRVGYILSQPEIIQNIDRVRNGKEVNVLAQVAAIAALRDIAYMQRCVQQVRQTREWLVKKLVESGIDVHTTPANYILVRVTELAKVLQELKTRGLLVRDRSYLPQLEGYIRVSIGTSDEMQYFFDVFTEIMRAQGNGG